MIRRLEMAIALDTYRSFHRAARALGISQPSLTRALQVLETEMGARLFERSKGDCEPTTFGKIVLEHARRVVSEVAEAKRAIALLKGLDVGEFAIGLGSGEIQQWVASAIGRLCAANPKLKVRTVEYLWHQLPDALMSSDIDVAVGEAGDLQGYPEIVVSRLPKRSGAVACRPGHPLTSREKIGIEDLAQYRFVGAPVPFRVGVNFPPGSAAGSMSANSRFFTPAIMCSGWNAIVEIVRHSDALAFRARSVIQASKKRGELVDLPFEAPWLRTEFAVMWRRDRMLHPALKDFRDAARRREAEMAGDAGSLRAVA